MARGAVLSPEFEEQVITVRGIDYKLRELSIGEFDELQKKATVVRTNPLTGEDNEDTDSALLLRLMVLACVVEPKLTSEKFTQMPMRAAGRLNAAVNRMHFGEEPASTTKKKDEEEPAEGESGNE